MRTLRMLLICLAVLVGAGSASADSIVLTLDDGTIPDDIQCGDTWIESGVVLGFVPTTDEDCTLGACSFGLGVGGVWLYPCRLNVDLRGICGVMSAEIDITDYCSVGCTRAFFYEGMTTVDTDSNTLVSAPETLMLSAGSATVDRLAVSSCECALIEIRIEYDPSASAADAQSWGAIKSLYR